MISPSRSLTRSYLQNPMCLKGTHSQVQGSEHVHLWEVIPQLATAPSFLHCWCQSATLSPRPAPHPPGDFCLEEGTISPFLTAHFSSGPSQSCSGMRNCPLTTRGLVYSRGENSLEAIDPCVHLCWVGVLCACWVCDAFLATLPWGWDWMFINIVQSFCVPQSSP